MFFVEKRLNVIVGHYGSGKTNLAVNMAMDLSSKGIKVAIIDLDIVNPYFRTSDFKEMFDQHGIQLAAPLYARSNLDIPALPPEIKPLLCDENITVIVDVGGDDTGAIALGRNANLIQRMDYDMFYVINQYRLGTAISQDAVSLLDGIQVASRLRTTQIVNNSNLGTETTARDILTSLPFAEKICQMTGLPLAATTFWREKAAQLEIPMAYPVQIYVKKPWEQKIL